MSNPEFSRRMEQAIRSYIAACNRADSSAIAAHFTANAAHYFPNWARWAGNTAIGDGFAKLVSQTSQRWTVDRIVTDTDRQAAVLEWTLVNPKRKRVIRGVDWFEFDPITGRFNEVRCYYAGLHPDRERQELVDFDYGSRGYPTERF